MKRVCLIILQCLVIYSTTIPVNSVFSVQGTEIEMKIEICKLSVDRQWLKLSKRFYFRDFPESSIGKIDVECFDLPSGERLTICLN